MKQLSKKYVLLLGVGFGLIGAVLLLRSFAATTKFGVEAENGTRSGQTAICDDTNASANKYLKLSQNTCTGAPTPTPTTGGGGDFDVYLAYADGNSRGHGDIPNPWKDSPNTIFAGRDDNGCCVSTGETPGWDGGAVRVVNNSGSTLTVVVEITDMGYCNRTWPSQSVPSGSNVIFTSTAYVTSQGDSNSWDTSDADWACRNTANTNNCNPILGTVNVTVNGTRHSYRDSEGIMAALKSRGGSDSTCSSLSTPGSEYTPWTLVSSISAGNSHVG